jgi:hypothetical protein
MKERKEKKRIGKRGIPQVRRQWQVRGNHMQAKPCGKRRRQSHRENNPFQMQPTHMVANTRD